VAPAEQAWLHTAALLNVHVGWGLVRERSPTTSPMATSPTWPSTSPTPPLDHGLATELHHNPDYRTIQVIPYGTEVKPVGQGTYVIWKYQPRR
jgi:hypothetical protein